jgi:hypothetical protein
MLQKAPDVTLSSVLCPSHSLAVVEFLRTTRLGYTANLTPTKREERGEVTRARVMVTEQAGREAEAWAGRMKWRPVGG